MGEQVAALIWGCSSVGRAPALQAGGHEFESHHLHESNEENVRTGRTGTGECIYANEPVNVRPKEGIRRIPVMSKMRSICESPGHDSYF